VAIPRRGLQDIRTISGKVGKVAQPYKAYLRISHIEMEKARKTLESQAAQQTMADIAARLAEIEAEKQALLLALREGSSNPEPPPAEPARRRGFKIRY
jgi:hypothetical protein